jgi:hypothetical protein
MPTDERQRFLGELEPSQRIDSPKRAGAGSRLRPPAPPGPDSGKPEDPGAYQQKTGEIKKHPLDD